MKIVIALFIWMFAITVYAAKAHRVISNSKQYGLENCSAGRDLGVYFSTIVLPSHHFFIYRPEESEEIDTKRCGRCMALAKNAK